MVARMMMNLDNEDKWLNFKQRLEQLKSVVDPKQLLEHLGFDITNVSSHELRGRCIIHGGDNETAFRFNKKFNTWVCFSHRCHEEWGNDVIGLIRAVRKVGFPEAVDCLKQIVGDFEENYLIYKREREMSSFIEDMLGDKQDRRISEENLTKYKVFRSNYFLTKGYSNTTLDFFEIGGGYADKDGNIRDVIPIRDDKGVLVAYAYRNIKDKAHDDKKYIFTKNFKGDRVLYNLFRAKDYSKNKPLIVVEGQKSVWRLHEYGINNVVASFGAHLSNKQLNLLYTYAINGVVMFYDNDMAGIMGSINACERMRGKLDSIGVFITEVDHTGKGLDPSDLDKNTIYNYLKGYF